MFSRTLHRTWCLGCVCKSHRRILFNVKETLFSPFWESSKEKKLSRGFAQWLREQRGSCPESHNSQPSCPRAEVSTWGAPCTELRNGQSRAWTRVPTFPLHILIRKGTLMKMMASLGFKDSFLSLLMFLSSHSSYLLPNSTSSSKDPAQNYSYSFLFSVNPLISSPKSQIDFTFKFLEWMTLQKCTSLIIIIIPVELWNKELLHEIWF